MSFDPNKLTPAPWDANSNETALAVWHDSKVMVASGWSVHHSDKTPSTEEKNANMAFIALARNAFDVMMRRGWHAYFDEAAQGWFLGGHHGSLNAFSQSVGACFSDPFTALVEADKFYRENVEKQA